MTPEDLPQTLAYAIAARGSADDGATALDGIDALLADKELERQWHRIERLEHAISLCDATTPALALTQMLIALDVLRRFLEQDLSEADRTACYWLATDCLTASYRHFKTAAAKTPLPTTLTEFYVPKFVRK